MSTQPSRARIWIPVLALGIAVGVVTISFLNPPPSRTQSSETETDGAGTDAENASADGADGDGGAADGSGSDADGESGSSGDGDDAGGSSGGSDGSGAGADGDADRSADAAEAADASTAGPSDDSADDVGGAPVSLDGLTAVAAGSTSGTLQTITLGDGSDDPMDIVFTRNGAGIVSITLNEVWETADANRQAKRHAAAVEAGRGDVDPPDPADRYRLAEQRVLLNRQTQAAGLVDGTTIPELAAGWIWIDGEIVSLLRNDQQIADGEAPAWAEIGPGRFATEIRNSDDQPLVRVERTFTRTGEYGIELRQRVLNLTERPLEISWMQYGPGDLRVDRSRYMDRRRYRLGTVMTSDGLDYVIADKRGDMMKEHVTLEKTKDVQQLWPTEDLASRDLDLSWFAVTNRYFAFAVHPLAEEESQVPIRLDEAVQRITYLQSFDPTNPEKVASIFVRLKTPPVTVEPSGETAFDFAIYAGPLDPDILDEVVPYTSLGMGRLILYQMSAFCAICTFQWLAHLLIAFLGLLHDYVVFDWGIAIICLVLVVRLLLHPITKKSQIGMQRFSRAMTKMKPELEKLQSKYKDDPKRMQAEQMRLWREHGVSPFQMLGCLPMFLQTPIWIALYAALYFAYDLRQEPAFFGVFQMLGGWSFLGDLSSADHFFYEFATPYPLFGRFNITGLNVLPLLMGAIFYVQQKYMSPPPSATMTPEQQTQQKIMRVMMVVLFPILLYSAPSGLTLYILTSSTIGILESRYIRNHVDQLDARGELKSTKPSRLEALMKAAEERRRAKDPQARMYEDSMKARRKKIQSKQTGPSRTFKRKKK